MDFLVQFGSGNSLRTMRRKLPANFSIITLVPISLPSWSPTSAAALHTASGVAGMAMFSCPSASVMALMAAAGAAMAPASPQPLMPSGLDGQGVLASPR